MTANTATIPHFTAEKVRAHSIALLPIAEQRAIADFLDRETAKIDALIEKQTELITRLRERRVALIVRLTTRGLDTSDLVGSGIYWAGDIPSSWGRVPLKRIFSSIQSGVWGDEAKGDNNDVSCIRVADFDRPRLRVGEAPTLRNVTWESGRSVGCAVAICSLRSLAARGSTPSASL